MAEPLRFLLCLEVDGGEDGLDIARLVEAAVEHSTAREALETAITEVAEDATVSLRVLGGYVVVPAVNEESPLLAPSPQVHRYTEAHPTARGPLECAPLPHTKDEDCAVIDGSCIACHVEHGEPCPECGKRAFHVTGCQRGEPREHRCKTCRGMYTTDEIIPLDQVADLEEWLDPGDETPSGKCPRPGCHSMTFTIDPEPYTLRARFDALVEALHHVLPYAESRVEDLTSDRSLEAPSEHAPLVAAAQQRVESARDTLRAIAPELFTAEGHLITVPLPEG